MTLETTLDFLGTGGAMNATRTHSTVLVDGRWLLDVGPTAVAQMKRLGAPLEDVQAVFISHFHADHTFGLPLLLLERAFRHVSPHPLTVVGPPGLARYGASMLALAFPGIDEKIAALSQVRWEEVADGREGLLRVAHDEQPGHAGLAVYEAIAVEHCALPCFGYRLLLNGVQLAYSGDTGLCDALFRLGDDADALIVEMNCWERSFPGHMNRADVQALVALTTARRVILTHVDDEPTDAVAGTDMPGDLERMVVRREAIRAAA